MGDHNPRVVPPSNLARIVEDFNRHGVSYLTIGGISGLLHGMVHCVTQDVDMMVQASAKRSNVSALNELGAEVGGITIDDIGVNTQWDTPSGPIDILLTALGPNETVITFSELDRYSKLFEIENGLLVPTSSLDDLIRMKESCGSSESARSSQCAASIHRTANRPRRQQLWRHRS